MSKTKTTARKSGGRPRARAVPINVRMPPNEVAALDNWIKRQGETDLSRPIAIRLLVELGLDAIGKK